MERLHESWGEVGAGGGEGTWGAGGGEGTWGQQEGRVAGRWGEEEGRTGGGEEARREGGRGGVPGVMEPPHAWGLTLLQQNPTGRDVMALWPDAELYGVVPPAIRIRRVTNDARPRTPLPADAHPVPAELGSPRVLRRAIQFLDHNHSGVGTVFYKGFGQDHFRMEGSGGDFLS